MKLFNTIKDLITFLLSIIFLYFVYTKAEGITEKQLILFCTIILYFDMEFMIRRINSSILNQKQHEKAN